MFRSIFISSAKLLSGLVVAFPFAVVALEVPAPADQKIAPDQILVTGPAGNVTNSEVETEVHNLVPPEQLESFWGNMDAVKQFALAIYARRSLAADAKIDGLDRSLQVQREIRLADERILSQLLMDKRVQTALPDDQVILARAKSEYQANADQFRTSEEIHVRHILLPLSKDGSNDSQVRQEAEMLLKQLQAGADFTTLAKEKSADKASAARGGDLGFFPRGRMVPEFEKAAFALQKAGDLSGPVKTKFGYHIIQMVERKPAKIQKMEEVLPNLKKGIIDKLERAERQKIWESAQSQAQVNETAIEQLAKYKKGSATQ